MCFVYNERKRYFNTEPIRMEVFDIVAPTNDWEFSTFIKFEISSRTRTLSSLREVQDHAAALPIISTAKQVSGFKKSLLLPTEHVRLKDGTAPKMCCATHAMSLILKTITGISAIDAIESRFPPANHANVSFALLYSVPVIHQQLDYQVIRFHRSTSTNNLAMLDLFRLHATGVC